VEDRKQIRAPCKREVSYGCHYLISQVFCSFCAFSAVKSFSVYFVLP
jgi:hypothetical protein